MADRPVILAAADPPLRTDSDEVAEAKALAAVETWAGRHGLPFGGLLLPAPVPHPRHIIGYDEKGFPCLGDDCPRCAATALIINEWNAAECLSCSWREFGPDSPRADYSKWPDESRAIPGARS